MENTEIIDKENADILDNKKDIDVKNRIRYAIVALCYLAAIFLSHISVIFKPFYKRVYYGQANGHFQFGLGILFLIIFFIIIEKVIKKKLNIEYNKDKKPLTWKMAGLVFGITFLIVFIISACSNFELKPFYDVGNNTTAYKVGVYATTLAYHTICVFFAVGMIENFQYALDDIIPFKNENVRKYIPYGGIMTMLTYGIYSLCIGLGGNISVLYFFLIILYGEIYLLTNRSILKTCASVGLIFVL